MRRPRSTCRSCCSGVRGAGEHVPRLGCRGKAPASVVVACRRGVRYSMELKALLRGELWLTFDILLGLLIGDLVLRWGLADRLMRRMMPWLRRHGIGPLVGLALTLSLGSAKAGAAVLASALSEGRIDRHTALWGTLSLAFPAYLRRWPATLVLSVSMTGLVGGIFALVLILRSLVRFALVVCVLRSRESGELPREEVPSS